MDKTSGNRRAKYLTERLMKGLFIASSVFVSLIIFTIILFLGEKGLQTFSDVSPATFFFDSKWAPDHNHFGALSFLAGTFSLAFLSLVFSVPIALLGAIFMAKIAPSWMREIMRPATDLFVGIPSVVYGLIGMTVIAPWLGHKFGGTGYGVLVASLIVAIMVMPTILSVTEDVIRSLSGSLEEASYALGATRSQTIFRVLLPAAWPGILTAIILGLGRALGETMAVQMVIGNSPILIKSLVKPTATLTSEIAMEMPYTQYGTTWNNALFLMALVLLLVSLALILIIRVVSRRRVA